MKPFHSILFAIFITAVFVGGCLPDSETDESAVIASVGGEELTLESALRQIPEIALREDTLQAIESFKSQWINSKVTEKEARRLQLQNNAEFREQLNRMERQLMEDMLKQYVLSEHEEELNVSRDEAQDYFQANRDRFVLDERHIRFRHITTNTRTEIDNARSDLMRGVEWERVLESYSVNPDLQLRESTQFWPYSMAVADIPMLNRYLGVIGISEISPIHLYRGQYHFVQLREVRNEGDHPDFEWLIPQIQQWLKLEKSQRITNAFIRNLYLQAESNNEIERLGSNETRSALMDFYSNTESN
ncbi:hypothetical protein DYD21_06870 [Rhodohalobacter sp. SW132]|uniref:hypothetical protein n=1 Tax=Rhodohalobacter sp. SW132 TaxID=2293433 RepID=UPI000E257FDB|nr:hypothetical protein [Rhodohalobacter sp. SW132]REL38322.1 hypothetical protein DYD21_06870 [Rhodohalobacter sp. SW132]